MVTEPEEPSSLTHQHEEDGGGPVKPFLEHLEDLRWTLIKSISSVLIGIVLCLCASKYLVEILLLPIRQAAQSKIGDSKMASLRLGDKYVNFQVATNSPWSGILTQQFSRIELEPTLDSSGNLAFHGVIKPIPKSDFPVDMLVSLKNYSPMGGFVVMVKIALYGGIGLASPFIFYFVGQFVFPALRRKEKDFLLKAVSFATVLFVCGVLFCYFFLLKVSFLAAVDVSEYLHFEANEWRAEDYMGFTVKFMLAMGLGFELPVILLTLVKIRLLDYKKLANFRMYWVVINLALSGIITPSGDPISMCLMALPLQFLYEMSIFIAWIWHKREQREELAGAA